MVNLTVISPQPKPKAKAKHQNIGPPPRRRSQGEMAAAEEKAVGGAAGKGKEKVVEASVPAAAAAAGGRGRFVAYPARVAEHGDVVTDAALFRAALEKLHAQMGTRLKVPIIGGKDLDLHQLYKEVTSRGGIDKVKAENRWREVTASFIFPATATNASFMLKKYYMSLLYHFEQLYFFRVQGWYQQEIDSRTNSFIVKTEAQASHKRKRGSNACSSDQAPSSDNTDVDVIIDGKFEHGYIVTVIMGSKSTKAVLYNSTEEPAQATPVPPVASNNTDLKGGRRHRRRRKKLSTTDPRHPKPNRSGYNFFFQDQHRMLKPQYSGQDRMISKMIGERWNNLGPEEKAVYQERGVQDKERYRTQLAAYKEELRTGQPISNAVPIQQRLPQTEVTNDQVGTKVSEGDMLVSNQGYSSSDESDHSGEKAVGDEELNTDTSAEMSMETTDSPGQPDPAADRDRFELRRRENPKADKKQNDPPDS
ncbi:high mobility group B protein 15-like [Phragmites australis]|uniref:high mobility group B protein 15-like n=1 Tax=Phragmites australis TaxID=29695 RepID=UPI002D765651|nr:high mobility group B protein 15-like [Phragmites australis]